MLKLCSHMFLRISPSAIDEQNGPAHPSGSAEKMLCSDLKAIGVS